MSANTDVSISQIVVRNPCRASDGVWVADGSVTLLFKNKTYEGLFEGAATFEDAIRGAVKDIHDSAEEIDRFGAYDV